MINVLVCPAFKAGQSVSLAPLYMFSPPQNPKCQGISLQLISINWSYQTRLLARRRKNKSQVRVMQDLIPDINWPPGPFLSGKPDSLSQIKDAVSLTLLNEKNQHIFMVWMRELETIVFLAFLVLWISSSAMLMKMMIALMMMLHSRQLWSNLLKSRKGLTCTSLAGTIFCIARSIYQ